MYTIMAFPTSVNDQITDSVTQSNISVTAQAPSVAMSSLYQVLTNSLSIAVQNAVTNQQQLNAISSASTSNCVAHLLDTKIKK